MPEDVKHTGTIRTSVYSDFFLTCVMHPIKTILILLFFNAIRLGADHGRGGYITWECLGNDEYLITIHNYYKCSADSIAQDIFITIGNKTYKDTASGQNSFAPIESYCPTRCNVVSPILRHRKLLSYYKLDLKETRFSSLLKNSCMVRITVPSPFSNRYSISTVDPSGEFCFSTEFNHCLSARKGTKGILPNFSFTTRFAGTVFFNPGIYRGTNDSINISFSHPQQYDGSSFVPVVFLPGFNATEPFDRYCLGTRKSCPPVPSAQPPLGISLHPLTGDLVYSQNGTSSGIYCIRASQFVFDTAGIPRYNGYLEMVMLVFPSAWNTTSNLPPAFKVPENVKICVSDSFVTTISPADLNTSGTPSGDSLYFRITGDTSVASWVVTDSVKSKPVLKLKIKAPGQVARNRLYVITVKVRDQICGFKNETSKSIVVQFTNDIYADVRARAGKCNNIILKAGNAGPVQANVRHKWLVYQNTMNSTPVFSGTGDSFMLSGLNKSRYIVSCSSYAAAGSFYCGHLLHIDTVDLTGLPAYASEIYPARICDTESELPYFLKSLTGFNAKPVIEWYFNGIVAAADTLKTVLQDSSLLYVRLTDTTGCVYRDTFLMAADSLNYLKIFPDTVLCRPQSFDMKPSWKGHANPFTGKWLALSGLTDSFHFSAASVNFPFRKTMNKIYSDFISTSGCKKSFESIIRVDTTTISISDEEDYCRSAGRLMLNDIPHRPTGGTWSTEWGNDSFIVTDTFSQYPKSTTITYHYKNNSTGCLYTAKHNILISDTAFIRNAGTVSICSEIKSSSPYKLFNPGRNGTWISLNKDLHLKDTVAFSFVPEQTPPGRYTLNFQYYESACPTVKQFSLMIKERQVSLFAESDIRTGNTPLTVIFRAGNKLYADSNRWLWQFSQNPADTANSDSAVFTYRQSGMYRPVIIGSRNGCTDTFYLPEINVGTSGLYSDHLANTPLLHPIPASSVLYINHVPNLESVSIINYSGQVIRNFGINHHPVAISVADLPEGMYLLHGYGRNGETILKQRISIMRN